jgi:hypothetical protein
MIDVLPEIRPLVIEDYPMDLGPGVPNLAVKPLLQELQRELPKKAKDRGFALACLAGLWLYHSFLDESHAISQDLDTLEGSYWHAILHRREPDYGNAKYWFRRVPRHAIFPELCRAATNLTTEEGTPPGSEFLLRQQAWNAAAFVDLCEIAHGQVALDRLCRLIQGREWELLVLYCHGQTFIGRTP